jgi:TetR/AcrR family transcriptional regulator, transcriptional repressor for nem operon
VSGAVHTTVIVFERPFIYAGAMSRPRQFDPDQVVDRSMREFWAKGYRETSVGDLVQATGVQPGSLYGAFQGGKRQLFIEALKLYSTLVVPQKLGALERSDASLAEVRAYFDGLVSDLMSPEGRIGCLMVNTTIELAAEDSEVSHLTRAHMARLERNAQRALRTAQSRGEISLAIDPAAKATQLMATGMGLMVVGKTNPGREVLETIVKAAFADLA